MAASRRSSGTATLSRIARRSSSIRLAPSDPLTPLTFTITRASKVHPYLEMNGVSIMLELLVRALND
jgi:hypothetical protein